MGFQGVSVATFKSGVSSVPIEKNGSKVFVATFVVQIARFDLFLYAKSFFNFLF